MRGLLRLIVLALPLATATALVVHLPTRLDALDRASNAALLVSVLRSGTWVLPLVLALAAARFNQSRLVFGALVLGWLGVVLHGPLESPDDVELSTLAVMTAASFLLLSVMRQRPVLGRGSLVLATLLAGSLAATVLVLLRQPQWPARLLADLGPAGREALESPLPWLAVGALALATPLLLRLPGTDGEQVGGGLFFTMLAAVAALLSASGDVAQLDVPLAGTAFLLAGTLTLNVTLHVVAWRRSYVDQLTGLPGRRALDEALPCLGGTHAVAVVDVDHFKKFNDKHGHDTGDDVLRLVAGQLRRLRAGTAYRQGGEEFVLLFPGRQLDEVLEELEGLRAEIAERKFVVRRRAAASSARSGPSNKPLRLTVSIGAAERSRKNGSPGEVLAAADAALLRAKKAGRNRVQAA